MSSSCVRHGGDGDDDVHRLLVCRKSRSRCCVDGQTGSFCGSEPCTILLALACVRVHVDHDGGGGDHTSLAYGNGHGELSRLYEGLSAHHCSCGRVIGTVDLLQLLLGPRRHRSAEVPAQNGICVGCRAHVEHDGDGVHQELHD